MLLFIGLIVLAFLLFSVPTEAQNVYEYLQPSCAQIEYAGNYGLMSVGVGQSFLKKSVTATLIGGYLPKQINGVEVITFALKNSFRVKQFDIWENELNLYAGFSLNYYHVHNTYVRFPFYFPKGYYDFPLAFHAAPLIGASWSLKKGSGLSVFGEFSTIDYYLINYFRNQSMNFLRLWNLGLGVAWHFK